MTAIYYVWISSWWDDRRITRNPHESWESGGGRTAQRVSGKADSFSCIVSTRIWNAMNMSHGCPYITCWKLKCVLDAYRYMYCWLHPLRLDTYLIGTDASHHFEDLSRFLCFFLSFFPFSFFFFFFKKREKVGEDWRERGKCESSTRVGKSTRVGYEIFCLMWFFCTVDMMNQQLPR